MMHRKKFKKPHISRKNRRILKDKSEETDKIANLPLAARKMFLEMQRSNQRENI